MAAKFTDIVPTVLVLAGAGYIAVKYSQKHLQVEAQNLRLKIAGVNLQDQDITINVKVLNPNSENMEIQSFVGAMYAGKKKVAEVNMFGDYIAKGNNEITVPLIAKPLMINLMQQLASLFKSGQMLITFEGTINVNNHAIPLTMSYTK